MAGRRSKHVRLFLTAGAARLAEADLLRAGSRSLGAVYLAGYAVECVLKALILSLADEHEQADVIAEFRGGRAHDLTWLKALYREAGGAAFPRGVAEAFVVVDTWGTELRYSPRVQYPGDADAFFRAVDTILGWANERI